jgi:hypothetical protein
LDALNALPAATVGGKIVFINQRMSAHARRLGLRCDGEDSHRGSERLPVISGAVAVLIRFGGYSEARHAHTGIARYRVDAPRIPGARVVESRCRSARALAQTGKPVRLRVKSTAAELPATWSANVIGEIPGTERAN